jgi:hypothetical protein
LAAKIRPLPLPSTLFAVNSSLTIAVFDVAYCVLQIRL